MEVEFGPLRAALGRVGDRWTLQVVAVLLRGPRRFGDLQRDVGGIAPNVLSQRLKAMEEHGLVVATPYQQRPLRLDYELTARGRELGPTIDSLMTWADEAAGPAHPPCGTTLNTTAWCPTCEIRADAPVEDLFRL